eukprot:jgi/Mesvir1/9993/Mv05784-RA.1
MEGDSEPVVNINVLVDSKKEYVDQLERGMTDPVFQVLKRMVMDAINVSREAGMDPISAFVQLVEEIPEWTPEIVEEETEQIMEKIPYLRDLLKAYFVCTSMIMGSIRMSKDPNQTMRVRAIREAVKNTVHVLMPIDDILKEYMGELLNKDTFKGGEEEAPDPDLIQGPEDPAAAATLAGGGDSNIRQVQVARQALVRKPSAVPQDEDIGGVTVISGRNATRYPVSPEAVSFIRSTLDSGKEIGGTFVPDGFGTLQRFKTTAFGHTNDVQIPHGTFEWHTHPQRCGMTDCSLSSPSDTDVGIILDDAGSENISHMVFNHSGVFVMTLTPSLVRTISTRGKRVTTEIRGAFTKLQDEFAKRFRKTRTEQDKDEAERWHQREWLKMCKSRGIHVLFFPYTQTPYVPVGAGAGAGAARP